MNWAGDSGVALVLIARGGGRDYSCLVVATKSSGRISARRCCESLQAAARDRIWISVIGQPDFMMPVLAGEQAIMPGGQGKVFRSWTAVNIDTGEWVAEDARFNTARPVTINAGWKEGAVTGCWIPGHGCIVIIQSGGVAVAPGMHESASATVPRVEFTQSGDSTIVAKSKDWKSVNEETVKLVLGQWAAAKFDREFTVKLEK